MPSVDALMQAIILQQFHQSAIVLAAIDMKSAGPGDGRCACMRGAMPHLRTCERSTSGASVAGAGRNDGLVSAPPQRLRFA